jgi:hypothetical protein
MLNTRGTRLRTVAAGGLIAASLVSACGEDDFANEPRPPVALTLTGVITEERVTVSPDDFGAGPIVLTISNQTGLSHRAVIKGEADDGTEVDEMSAPINPLDTATLQQDLPEGEYTVSANSDGVSGIRSDRLRVGPERDSASDELELP